MSNQPPLDWTNDTVKLGDLKPWADNPRMSTKAQARRILASFEKFGQVQPVAVGPDNSVYDGHQRLSALLTIHGAEYAIDCRRANRPLDDAERRALVLALHNATGAWDWNALAGWDAEAMKAGGFDAELLKAWNNDANNLKEFLNAEKPAPADAEPAIDRAAELNEKWRVKTGDLWQIGEHRLLCGDSTSRDDVVNFLDGAKAELMVTDPPYGVAYHSNKKGAKSASIEGDLTQAAIPLSFAVAIECALDKNARVYLFGGSANFPMYSKLFDHYLRMQPRPIIWVKESFVLHPTHYHSQFEICFFGWLGSGGGANFWYGERNVSDVWKVTRDATKDRVHPTQKPAELVEIPVANSSPLGGIVYEPFAGSGTTLVACQNLSRKCRAIEISPNYCAVILERMATAFPELEIVRLDNAPTD